MNNKKKINLKFILYSIISSILYFLIFGFISAIFPNPFFKRMTEVFYYDWIFIIFSSILIGIFIYQYFLIKEIKNNSENCLFIGGTLSFLAFSCPICNKLILILFGFSGTMNYFAPIQPIIGIIGLFILIYSNLIIFKLIKK